MDHPSRIRTDAETAVETQANDAAPATAVSGRPWGNDHPVNIRLSLPLLFGRYYVTIVAGRERRSHQRRIDERRKHPLVTAGNLVVMAAFGTVVGLGALYLIQTGTRALFAG